MIIKLGTEKAMIGMPNSRPVGNIVPNAGIVVKPESIVKHAPAIVRAQFFLFNDIIPAVRPNAKAKKPVTPINSVQWSGLYQG